MQKMKVILTCLLLSLGAAASADCDSARGKTVFNKCAAYHSLEAGVHLVGPSLANVVGRRAASAEGFIYSPAMEQAGISWSKDNLSAFLENPQAVVPATIMPFGGLKNSADRDAVICYIGAGQ